MSLSSSRSILIKYYVVVNVSVNKVWCTINTNKTIQFDVFINS